ncbi:MAG: MFS transporter [Candidatus Hodarchaeota archaeon]
MGTQARMKSGKLPGKGFFIQMILTNIVALGFAAVINPLAKDISQDELISEDQVFYAQSIFYIVTAVFTIIWAFAADKVKRVKLLIVSMIIWSGAGFLHVLVDNVAHLIAFQVILGVGVSATVPLTYSLTTDIIPKDNRSVAFSFLGVAQNLGSGFAFLLSGLLVDLVGWEGPFVILAILGLVGLPIFALKFKEPRKGQMEEELSGLVDSEGDLDYKIGIGDLKMVITTRSNFWILMSSFTSMIITGAVGASFITFMRNENDHNALPQLATGILVLTFISQLIFPVVIGRFADKIIKKNPLGNLKILISCTLIAFPTYCIGLLMQFKFGPGGNLIEGNIIIFILFVLIMFIALGFASVIPAMIDSALSFINLPEKRSPIYAMVNITRTVGRGLGIAILAYLSSSVFGGKYGPGMASLTIFFIISIVPIIPCFKTYIKDIKKVNEELKSRGTTS